MDRALEPRVVERDQTAAPLANQVVVMLPAGEGPLESSQPLTNRDPLVESVLDQELEHPVHARAPDPLASGAQRVLDLDCAQRARLGRKQLDDPLARAAASEPRAREYLVGVLRPGGRIARVNHSAQDYPVAPTEREWVPSHQ
jgi:hypothetical protein